ncbi:12feb793-2eca-4160-99e4-e2aa8f242210 [Thermothielavioides terrestris]|uniref:12feb793-2eca-4160-99e4-e2aa8f242210 n=1 Tax=Thermothielavioides terrestris TaxID=2587410 RepID=A0A3S4AMG4_9PEZI|nr:12feb793-2eca-4160-99e4-e2aa8f242210 [Thermothielavioides terrestris]
MCGPETPSSTPRVGARVDFFPAAGVAATQLPVGNLLFVNPTSPSSSHATHVRFQQRYHSGAAAAAAHDEDDSDLTQPLSTAGILQQFTLRSSSNPGTTATTTETDALSSGGVDVPLAASLLLAVGADGIIGRRVSVRRGRGGAVLADGIVGFNFLPPAVKA